MSENEDKKNESKEEGPEQAPNKPELAIAFDGPAFVVNKTFYTGYPGGVRLSFVEQAHEMGHFRAAVYLNYKDAIALKDLLARNLADVEKQIKDLEDEGSAG